MAWTFTSAFTENGTCEITFTSDVANEDGTFPTLVRWHTKDRNQNDTAWKANIRREITADLAELNPVALTRADVTSVVTP